MIAEQRSLIEDLAHSNEEYIRKFERLKLGIDGTAVEQVDDAGGGAIEREPATTTRSLLEAPTRESMGMKFAVEGISSQEKENTRVSGSRELTTATRSLPEAQRSETRSLANPPNANTGNVFINTSVQTNIVMPPIQERGIPATEAPMEFGQEALFKQLEHYSMLISNLLKEVDEAQYKITFKSRLRVKGGIAGLHEKERQELEKIWGGTALQSAEQRLESLVDGLGELSRMNSFAGKDPVPMSSPVIMRRTENLPSMAPNREPDTRKQEEPVAWLPQATPASLMEDLPEMPNLANEAAAKESRIIDVSESTRSPTEGMVKAYTRNDSVPGSGFVPIAEANTKPADEGTKEQVSMRVRTLRRKNMKGLALSAAPKAAPAHSVGDIQLSEIPEEDVIPMGASGLPVADDPLPEIGHGFEGTIYPAMSRNDYQNDLSVAQSSQSFERGHDSYNPQPAVTIEDPNDTVAVKRARNTFAARKSRAKRMERTEELVSQVTNLEAEAEHWKSIALSFEQRHGDSEVGDTESRQKGEDAGERGAAVVNNFSAHGGDTVLLLEDAPTLHRAPAAPTTSHAPFSFGGQSPQGDPQFYGPTKNELTQEKLVLPATKRRKGNNFASPSTPAQAPIAAAPDQLTLFGKTESPEPTALPVTGSSLGPSAGEQNRTAMRQGTNSATRDKLVLQKQDTVKPGSNGLDEVADVRIATTCIHVHPNLICDLPQESYQMPFNSDFNNSDILENFDFEKFLQTTNEEFHFDSSTFEKADVIENAKSYGPFAGLEGCVVARCGTVEDKDGNTIGTLTEGNAGNADRLVGHAVDEDGNIVDKHGSIIGHAELYEEILYEEVLCEEVQYEEEVKADLSILKGLTINKQGKVIGPEGVPIARLVEGNAKELVGKKCDEEGQLWNDSGKVIGRCELFPENEREAKYEGPFTGLEGCVVVKDAFVEDEDGNRVGVVVEGDAKRLIGRAVDEDGDIIDRFGNIKGHVEPYEEPEEEVADLFSLEGKFVNKAGNVVDEHRTIFGRIAEGNPDELAGKKVDGQGQIWNDNSKVIGQAELLPGGGTQAPEGPFAGFENLVVAEGGVVTVGTGHIVGKLEESMPNAEKLLGRKVDEDGDIIDKYGNVKGHAEPYEEPEEEVADLSYLEEKTASKSGNVVDEHGIVEGDLEEVIGRKVDSRGQISTQISNDNCDRVRWDNLEVSQLPADQKIGSSLSRKLSTKRLFLGGTPKSNGLLFGRAENPRSLTDGSFGSRRTTSKSAESKHGQMLSLDDMYDTYASETGKAESWQRESEQRDFRLTDMEVVDRLVSLWTTVKAL